MLSNALHHFSVTVAPKSCISFALGERDCEWGEEHPAWQSQAILAVTEKNLFQPQPVIVFTYHSADTIALDSSSLLEIEMAEVQHEILCYFKNPFGNSNPRENWTLQ